MTHNICWYLLGNVLFFYYFILHLLYQSFKCILMSITGNMPDRFIMLFCFVRMKLHLFMFLCRKLWFVLISYSAYVMVMDFLCYEVHILNSFKNFPVLQPLCILLKAFFYFFCWSFNKWSSLLIKFFMFFKHIIHDLSRTPLELLVLIFDLVLFLFYLIFILILVKVSISPWSFLIIGKFTYFLHILHHDQSFKKLVLKPCFGVLNWATSQKFWSDLVPSCFPYQIETFGKVSVLMLMGRISVVIWIIWVRSDTWTEPDFCCICPKYLP